MSWRACCAFSWPLPCGGLGVDSGRQGVGPAVEEWFVLARHAEDLADGGDGKGVGEVLDDVDLVLALEGVE